MSSTLLASGSTSTSILEPSSLRSHDYSPQGPSHPMHYLPNRTSGRQTRHAMHRESQHYPMAERCMCSSCHLSAKLFPRTEDGRIMLPIVPVTRSVSAHGHVPFGHTHAYAGQPGDLVQYMLVPNEFGEFRISLFHSVLFYFCPGGTFEPSQQLSWSFNFISGGGLL